MNLRLVSFLLGRLSLACVGVMVLPLALAFFYAENTYTAFLKTIIIGVILAQILIAYGRMQGETITFREGVAVVGCGWLLITLLGALPYIFTGTLGAVSAFFESVSGFTTTGATTITNIEIVPKSVLFWRSLTHWMGGIGIIVIFIALLPHVGSGAVHMFNAEVTGPSAERVLPRIKNTSAALVKIYISFTLFLTVLLYFAGMNCYDAINHAFSTIATGGFSTYNSSVAAFKSPLIEGILTFFMILAGGNFALYYVVGTKGLRQFWKDTEFKVYIAIISVATSMIMLNLYFKNYFDLLESFRFAVFQVASVISTTGFVSNDFDVWPAFSKLCLVMLMFIGGCAGSTAGAIKVSRLVIFVKLIFAELKHTIHPSMVINVAMNKQPIAKSVIAGITRFFFLYIVLFAFFVLLMTMTGLNIVDSIGVIATTISSVGPGLGAVGATCTYAGITPFGKLVICLAMLLGRLELFTLMVLLRPEFWRSTRNW